MRRLAAWKWCWPSKLASLCNKKPGFFRAFLCLSRDRRQVLLDLLACWMAGSQVVFLTGVAGLLHAVAGRDSPRQATYLFVARPECRPQKARGKNVPCSQRPQKLRFAKLLGQPAVGANTGVRHNSLRAEALHSNRCRKSEHEVWLSFGSQTAAVCCDRRRWLKG